MINRYFTTLDAGIDMLAIESTIVKSLNKLKPW
jgi:hypothetical protein